ncbi:hypothetical protein C7293_00105 [filamentous cyanobacterium CCT1]|nr:hypothetical protein C7293_00105 [filamentous cyanobacterium CCT1]PSN76954.1 hypothetical protein C8B47_24600 [filamentous cyanobacterium CCP4]
MFFHRFCAVLNLLTVAASACTGFGNREVGCAIANQQILNFPDGTQLYLWDIEFWGLSQVTGRLLLLEDGEVEVTYEVEHQLNEDAQPQVSGEGQLALVVNATRPTPEGTEPTFVLTTEFPEFSVSQERYDTLALPEGQRPVMQGTGSQVVNGDGSLARFTEALVYTAALGQAGEITSTAAFREPGLEGAIAASNSYPVVAVELRCAPENSTAKR